MDGPLNGRVANHPVSGIAPKTGGDIALQYLLPLYLVCLSDRCHRQLIKPAMRVLHSILIKLRFVCPQPSTWRQWSEKTA